MDTLLINRNEGIGNRFEITGTGLKLIAILTMFVDHFALGPLASWIIENTPSMSADTYASYYNFYHVLRGIGRMSFPIYCYLLVEGVDHTRNIKKYAVRILTVALLSEIPFDYLFYGRFFYWYHNNVLWVLLLGLICLHLYSLVEKYEASLALKMVIMCVGMAIAHFTFVDYGEAGICCICLISILNGEDFRTRIIAFMAGVGALAVLSSSIELLAMAMVIPIALYRGERGRDSRFLRKFFYLFYPLHLCLLILVDYCI
ncbi:MAG: hypothetical protein IKZ85_02200 [Pseudobutyrivibrio sp.]|nr:hypothetical protein [Pseudobutyrivibrio sp.]